MKRGDLVRLPPDCDRRRSVVLDFNAIPESVENLTDKQCAALMDWKLTYG